VGGLFVKFDKFGLLSLSGAQFREALMPGKGQPEGVSSVLNLAVRRAGSLGKQRVLRIKCEFTLCSICNDHPSLAGPDEMYFVKTASLP
jgi:hypothetical protein